MIKFIVPGKPQGKARARSFRTKSGGIGHFTPDKTVLYENLIKTICLEEMKENQKKYEGPVFLEIRALFHPIKKLINTKAKEKNFYSNDDLPCPICKPDADNIAKVVKDALNGIAYDDDKQVASLSVQKFYIHKDLHEDQRERIEVEIIDPKEMW